MLTIACIDIIWQPEGNAVIPSGLWSAAKMKRLQPDETIDLRFGSRIALRFYADSRPHSLQTARLHKGAIFVCDGTELVEEGLGIGVPVCRYQDGTRFSLSADTFVDDSDQNPTLVKIYDMNGIASKTFRRSPIRRGRPLARLLNILEKGYRAFRRLRAEANKMLDILSLLGMRSEYLESPSKGRVAVTYREFGRSLQIEADLDELSREGLQSVVFANEQGGTSFREYEDSNGTELHDRQIEPWQITEAEWANLKSRAFGVGFKLNRPSRWLMVRGREIVKDRISWSGLDLLSREFPHALKYSVEIVGDDTD